MIGIIGAMDEEVFYLKEKMEDVEEITSSNISFYKGKISGKDVVLVKSLIGKSNAAMSATILLEKFDIKYVINIGSAGGLKHDANISDLVIASHTMFHDVDVRCFGYEMGQVPHLPTQFECNQKLLEIAVKAMQKISKPYHIGLIVSGDQFIHNKEQLDILQKNIPNAIAVEMEAAAISLVMHHYNIPFIIIRSLSDVAGRDSNISFTEYLEIAAKNSSLAVEEMIKTI